MREIKNNKSKKGKEGTKYINKISTTDLRKETDKGREQEIKTM
jgi:hypothetical protein